MKIILTGAQGTGKTTVLNEFRKENYKIITEVVRNLHKQGININEMGDVEGQKTIFNTYKDIFENSGNNFISDRGLTDVCAYTSYMADKKPLVENKILANEQIKDMQKFADDNQDILYCYFPIEFPVVNDGIRSMDETFRKEIDSNIRFMLGIAKFDYIIVSGTVEERVNQIKQAIREREQRNTRSNI